MVNQLNFMESPNDKGTIPFNQRHRKLHLKVTRKLCSSWLAFTLSEYTTLCALGDKSHPWSYTVMDTACFNKASLYSEELLTVDMVIQLL